MKLSHWPNCEYVGRKGRCRKPCAVKPNGMLSSMCRYHQEALTLGQVAEEIERLIASVPSLALELARRRAVNQQHEIQVATALLDVSNGAEGRRVALGSIELGSMTERLSSVLRSKAYDMGGADPRIVAESVLAMVKATDAALVPSEILETAIRQLREGAGLRELYMAVHEAMNPKG